ncbi:MAG: cupin domain-containing protein [Candidatus Baltobacteraceae bacterium]
MDAEAQRLIDELALTAHPEGGFFREIFRSTAQVVDRLGRRRSALTVIYFLLSAEAHSTWHRLASDETWHFACGSPLQLELISERGEHEIFRLASGGPWEATIPAGSAFAARVADGGGYSLVSCCVAPGFEFADFTLLDSKMLIDAFPRHAAAIRRYARPPLE